MKWLLEEYPPNYIINDGLAKSGVDIIHIVYPNYSSISWLLFDISPLHPITHYLPIIPLNHHNLIGGLEHCFFSILGMSSSQLMKSYFSRWFSCTTNQILTTTWRLVSACPCPGVPVSTRSVPFQDRFGELHRATRDRGMPRWWGAPRRAPFGALGGERWQYIAALLGGLFGLYHPNFRFDYICIHYTVYIYLYLYIYIIHICYPSPRPTVPLFVW